MNQLSNLILPTCLFYILNLYTTTCTACQMQFLLYSLIHQRLVYHLKIYWFKTSSSHQIQKYHLLITSSWESSRLKNWDIGTSNIQNTVITEPFDAWLKQKIIVNNKFGTLSGKFVEYEWLITTISHKKDKA